MSNTYCAAAFKHIYTENDDRYKLCCYSGPTPSIAKYTATKHTPFEFFNSDEMEDIRTQMMSGQKVAGCETCYKIEEQGGQSYRTRVFDSNNQKLSTVGEVELKLRLFGSSCNLGCYMCFPMNSSTRRYELKQIDQSDNIFVGLKDQYKPVMDKHYQKTVQDILDNIDLITRIKFTGGEPFLMPRHYEFLFSIPEKDRKRIHISYDTNFTTLQYKNYTIDGILDSFPNVSFSVSCDHYGKKLEWIRYPIDVDQFEANLRAYKKYIHKIQMTASILNVQELLEIKQYYEGNFGIKTHAPSVASAPEHLSPKQLDQQTKDYLIDLYSKDLDSFYAVINELKKPCKPELIIKYQNYVKALDKNRGTNANSIWGKQIYMESD